MASIYVLEIDGWGEVGPAIAITDAEGFADGTFTLTTAGTPPPATEYGAMIWVEDCDAVIADGYYTLTARTATTFTMQALPADVTVTTAAGLSGLARIEDHYKISDSIPSWVTGSDALARWYPDLLSVSESAGQRIKMAGGVASVDGFEFAMTRRTGMAAVAADSYMLATRGPVVLHEALTGTADTVVTTSAVPFAGESASTPSGTAQPAWIGAEAVDVRGTITDTDSADGVTVYTMEDDGSATFVTRGVLRTFKRPHAKAVAVFGGMPTPIGQIGRAFVYSDGHGSHADGVEVAQGVIETINPSAGLGSAQVLALASALFLGPGVAPDVARASYPGRGVMLGSWPTVVEQSDGSEWAFSNPFKYSALAITRTGLAADSVDSNGVETWAYDSEVGVSIRTDFPTVRPPPDLESWQRVNLPRIWDEGPIPRERAIVVDSDGSANVWPAGIDRESRIRTGDPLCHVFSPVTWARSRNSGSITLGTSPRLVEVNPVDAILSILTSTGYGHNGDHDTAPSVFGLSINRETIEDASFTEVGNRLDAEAITAGSIALLTSEETGVLDRLDVLLRTYGLAIATTTAGLVRLIDLSVLDYDAAATLDEGDLVRPAAMSVGAGKAINSIVLNYAYPWISPDHASAKQNLIARAGSGGLLETLHRATGTKVTLKPWFGASVDPTSRQALGIRLARIVEQTNSVVGTISAEVDPGYTGQIGDTVSVTLPAFPNAQDSGGMSGALCRIIDRKHVSRPVGDNPNDEITLLAYGVTSADKPRQWSPSGVVDAVTNKFNFDLETSTYHGPDFTSDATSFTDGSKIDIYTTNWELRSTVSAGTVASTSGDSMTLSVAAAGGAGDVTPNVGDKIALASESDQSVSEAAKWGWLTTSTPGYLWR